MKKTVQIEESKARSMYNTASPEFKQLLEDTFGKEFFSVKITDRVKTYEDACSELGETPLNESELKSAGFTTDEINYRKLKTVTKALNEGWVPDWNNDKQQKWYPYFRLSSGVFVFCGAGYGYSFASAGDGSRLCFKSEELAEYAGKQFLDIYSALLQK